MRGVKMAFRYMGADGRKHETTGKGGIVLNISSGAGIYTGPEMPCYTAAKTGIVAYTRCVGDPKIYDPTRVKVKTPWPKIFS